MEITVDMHRGTSQGGTQEEAKHRNSGPGNLMLPLPDLSSLTKTCASKIHTVQPAGEVRRIENSTSRQVTFSKRRTGLFKKAYELSMLCEADVAVIIFSSSNRMYEYASSSMLDILERYRQCNSIGPPLTDSLLLQDVEKWQNEASYLRQCLKNLIDLQSRMMGENLSSLSVSDLQMLESTLGVALNRVIARKMELLQVDNRTVSEKDGLLHLQEENEFLKHKVAELAAISSGTEKTISTIGTASSRTSSECNEMRSCGGAHTSIDDCHDAITLKLGL